VKLVLEHAEVEIETGLKSEDRKIIASWRRLNLFAVRTEERGLVMSHGARPALNRNCRFNDFQHELNSNCRSYDEKDEPQPQERVEFGLMKLNPCRMSVSS
jgi:hypothetical protein